MSAALANVKHGKEVCRLARAGEHGRRAAFERADFCGNLVVGRVLQAGIEVACLLEVKQRAHGGAGVVFKRGALHNGNLPGLAVSRRVSRLHAARTNSWGIVLGHIVSSRPVFDDAMQVYATWGVSWAQTKGLSLSLGWELRSGNLCVQQPFR